MSRNYLALEGQQGKLIRWPEVTKRLGICRLTLLRGIRKGVYPEPIRLSTKLHVWRVEDIDEVLAKR